MPITALTHFLKSRDEILKSEQDVVINRNKSKKQSNMTSLKLISISLLLLTVSKRQVDNCVIVTCPEKCNCTTDHTYSGVLVNCSSRGLTQLPESFPIETTTLMLEDNKLTHLKNFSFIPASNLTVLNLTGNIISHIEEYTFQGLGNLKELYLTNNDLPLSSLTYPDGVFQPLTSLEILHINNNTCCTTRQQNLPICNISSNVSRENTPISNFSLEFQTELLNINHQKFSKSQINMQNQFAINSNSGRHGYKENTLNYPDVALSKLRSLRELNMDGLTNTTLGPGFRNLTHLVSLTLSGVIGFCSLQMVTRETFLNIPQIQNLSLTDCNITHLSDDSFSSLTNLTSLDLTFNKHLGFELLGKAFKGLSETKLNTLVINAIVPSWVLGITISTNNLMYFRNLTYLKTIVAGYNRIETFEDGVLCQCIPPSLENAFLNGNPFLLSTYFKDLGCLKNLKILHINGYESFNTPPYVFPVKKHNSHCLNVQSSNTCFEDTKQNALAQEFILPPKLISLQAKHFGLFYKLDHIPVNPNNSLLHIDLGDNHFPFWDGPITGLDKITSLRLQNASCQNIRPTFFDNFPQLKELDIAGNLLRFVIENDVEGRLFRGLKNLRKIYLFRMDIGQLPTSIFSFLTNLETLDLSNNGIGTFTPRISHMKNISYINLSKNPLYTLPKEVRDHLDNVAKTRNVTLDMTYNPILCECENLDFLLWMRDSSVQHQGLYSDYFCVKSGLSAHLQDVVGMINRLEYECEKSLGILFGAAVSCVVVLTVLCVALAYRFRWKLRYMYYASRLNFRRHQDPTVDEFKFDAFLSYSSEDTTFVMGELRSRLEEDFGLKLCIHQRDFTPGHYIASNILDAVQCSRHTLVVLTRAFSQSDWCNYELQMALMEGAHTDRDVLLFLLYEDVPKHELTRDIMFNIHSHSYIEFPHSEVDKNLFWNRLAEALRN